ncbi:unnamed protein product [Lupinus luteus]|uniref:Uncharacterized protein n=1 Tax=Lupinus luteus TaxID=3873 RepID=A0AAV1XUS5_LUPLU
MPLSVTTTGVIWGFVIQVWSNRLRKLPAMRHPWEHVLGMGLGAIFTNQYMKWSEQVEKDLEKMLQKAKAANENRYIDPWEHVVGMGLGVVFVNQLLKWEVQVEKDLDIMLERAKAANERRYIVINCCYFCVWIDWKGIEMVVEWSQYSTGLLGESLLPVSNLDLGFTVVIIRSLVGDDIWWRRDRTEGMVVLLQAQLILSVCVVEVDAQIHG